MVKQLDRDALRRLRALSRAVEGDPADQQNEPNLEELRRIMRQMRQEIVELKQRVTALGG